MKMRKNIELIAILMAVLAACLFTACDGGAMEELWKDELENGSVPVSERCTVTFVSNGGTEVASQIISKGTCAVKPKDPIFGTYTFNGWFLKNSDQSFDFSTPITEDLTLYAHWEGLVETKTTTKELDLSQGGTIVVAVSPIPSQKTSVAIPEGALSGTGSHSSELAVTSYAIEVSTTTFQILNQSAQNNLAVAGIDCALKIDDEIVSDFNKPIIITTYIPKGLSSVEVIYNGDAAKSQPDAGGTAPNKNVAKIYNSDIGETNLGYDKATGLLRFSTNHFSEFYVATNAELSIIKDSDSSDVYAMTLGDFRDWVNADHKCEGYTVTLLKDCDYTDENWVPIGFRNNSSSGKVNYPFCGIFDGNNKTVKVKNSNISSKYFGFFGQVTNFDNEFPKRIFDLTLEVDFARSTVANTDYIVGGLASQIFGHVDIDNVTVKGKVGTNFDVGGLIGQIDDTDYSYTYSINNCHVMADVSAISDYKNSYMLVGGIVGQHNCENGVTFTNCSYSGNLYSTFEGYETKAGNYAYLGYLMSKGGSEDKKEKTIVNNFSVGQGSTIKVYSEYDYDRDYEGYNTKKCQYTYTGSPNPLKELVGGYHGLFIVDGIEHAASVGFPHGSAE